MKSQKAQSQKKELNYENIPTQINEKSKEKNPKKLIKEKILNSRYMNNIHNNFYQKNTFDFINKNNKENKKNKNKSIKSNKDISNNINTPSFKKSIKSPLFKKSNIKKMDYTPDKKNSNKIKRKNKSMNINNNIIIKKEDDFLTRQAKYSAKKISDIKKLSQEIALLHSSSKKSNNKINNNINNASFISGLSCSKSMAEIENNISKLYEWEKRRKEKIEKMQEKKNKEEIIYSYIPKINKRSNTLAKKKKKNNNNINIFERLSKVDPLISERKKILEELYKPSFQPEIYYSNSHRNRYHAKSQNSNFKRKEKNFDYVIKVNRVNIKRNSIVNFEEKNEQDDVIQNLLRKTIIKNMQNKFKNNSADKRINITHLL